MPARTIYNWLKHFIKYRVLHVDDVPHRIALGVALSIFVAWTPAIGFQMVLYLLLAWLCGANKFVGLPFIWITNPATILPIYYPNYLVGRWILHLEGPKPDFKAVVVLHGSWFEQIRCFWSGTVDFAWPLWTGSLVVGIVLGLLAYLMTYQGVVIYRTKRPHLRLKLPGRRKRPAPVPPPSDQEACD